MLSLAQDFGVEADPAPAPIVCTVDVSISLSSNDRFKASNAVCCSSAFGRTQPDTFLRGWKQCAPRQNTLGVSTYIYHLSEAGIWRLLR